MAGISKKQTWVGNPIGNRSIQSRYLSESEKVYFITCKTCGDFFDSRNLAEVFTHVRHEVARLGRCKSK